jgi:hypothetical protein
MLRPQTATRRMIRSREHTQAVIDRLADIWQRYPEYSLYELAEIILQGKPIKSDSDMDTLIALEDSLAIIDGNIAF